MIETYGNDIIKNMPTFDTFNFMPNATFGLGGRLENYYENKDMIMELKKVYKYFNLPRGITFDKFNAQFNGITKQQYINQLNKPNIGGEI